MEGAWRGSVQQVEQQAARRGPIAILQLVDQLAELIHRGWQPPFTHYRLVDGRHADQLLERIRITVPSSIRESERTLAERDRILAEAKVEADRIVEDARRQVMQALNERSLLEQARYESQRIVEQGRTDAQYRVDEADRYTIGALRGLREELRALIHQVDSGLAVMEGQTGVGRAKQGRETSRTVHATTGETAAADHRGTVAETEEGDD